jgi:hypothetical protein
VAVSVVSEDSAVAGDESSREAESPFDTESPSDAEPSFVLVAAPPLVAVVLRGFSWLVVDAAFLRGLPATLLAVFETVDFFGPATEFDVLADEESEDDDEEDVDEAPSSAAAIPVAPTTDMPHIAAPMPAEAAPSCSQRRTPKRSEPRPDRSTAILPPPLIAIGSNVPGAGCDDDESAEWRANVASTAVPNRSRPGRPAGPVP